MALSRRDFCAALGAIGLSNATLPIYADDGKQKSLRVISYNVYVCKGWPDDRPLAKKAVQKGQMAKRLAMELALYDPDIINFSESPSEEITKAVAQHLGMNHVRFPSGGKWPGTLLSRFEITDSQNVPLGRTRPEELFTRHWGRATIHFPQGESLIVHSAHLFPVPDPTIRLKEIGAMLASMKQDIDSGRSMLLIGDLNHVPDSEEYKLWMNAGWIDTFAQVGEGIGTTFQADNLKRRIDYVMAMGPLASQIVESRPLSEGDFRVDISDDRSFALSDHLPQFAVFGEKN